MNLLSHKITSTTPEYGGYKKLLIDQKLKIEDGDSCNKFDLRIDLHTGTHIDFPKHFCPKGNSINYIIEKGYIRFKKWDYIELLIDNGKLINTINSKNLDLDIECLLIRTGWENRRNNDEYIFEGPGIHKDLAAKLKKIFPNLKAIGFDFISLTSYMHREHGRLAHKEFLCKNEILIIEDMKLSTLQNNNGTILITPWLIENVDGCPVNVYQDE